jgi:hypothetical protein
LPRPPASASRKAARSRARHLLQRLVGVPSATSSALGWSPRTTLVAVAAWLAIYPLLALFAPGRQFWHDRLCSTRLLLAEPREVRPASSLSSPVRIRTTWSIVVTKILPSPILPVLAALTIASMQRSASLSLTDDLDSSPWAGSRRRTPRRGRARCGLSDGRSLDLGAR